MTLGVAFVRKLPKRKDRDELVFVTDSRLTGGQALDDGGKIFRLPRSDALLAFAGDTTYAYPIAHHLIASIEMFPRSADRRHPLVLTKSHLVRVCTDIYRAIHSFPKGQDRPLDDEPRVNFLFGGFSWHDGEFQIWRIELDRKNREFVSTRARQFAFIGDDDATKDARVRTHKLLNDGKRKTSEIDMEPFLAIRDIIREQKYSSVGGVPQIAKVYRHMNTQFFATAWLGPSGKKTHHVFGRRLLKRASTSWPLFDADTLHFKVGDDDDSEDENSPSSNT